MRNPKDALNRTVRRNPTCTSAMPCAPKWLVLGLAMVAGLAQASEPPANATPQPPSVNAPVPRDNVTPVTGPQYIRQPIVKQPDSPPDKPVNDNDGSDATPAKIDAVRKQLDAAKLQVVALQQKRDSAGGLNQQEQLALKQAMTRQQQLSQTLSTLLQQQSDTSKAVIQNIK